MDNCLLEQFVETLTTEELNKPIYYLTIEDILNELDGLEMGKEQTEYIISKIRKDPSSILDGLDSSRILEEVQEYLSYLLWEGQRERQ